MNNETENKKVLPTIYVFPKRRPESEYEDYHGGAMAEDGE